MDRQLTAIGCRSCFWYLQNSIECRKFTHYSNLNGFPFSKKLSCFMTDMNQQTLTKQFPLEPEIINFLMNERIFKSYTVKNKQLIYFMEWRDLDFSIQTLLLFIDESIKDDRAASTVNIKRAQIKRIIREIAAHNPEKYNELEKFKIEQLFKKIQKVKIQDKSVNKNKLLSEEELLKLLKNLKAHNEKIWIITRLLVNTGLRITEAISLDTIPSYEEDGRKFFMLIGKGEKERTISIADDFYDEIISTFHTHIKYGPLICTQNGSRFQRSYITNMLRKLSRKIIGRPVGSHVMRHTFATLQLERGRDIKAISDYLGHSDTSTTQDMYIHTKLKVGELPGY